MKIKLLDIACARSGDKGDSSNIGIAFESQEVYHWAVEKITPNKVKDHLKGIAKSEIVRYELPNLLSLNFIIKGSLEGGGSDSLLHDAQGKTHAQLVLLMDIEVPDFFSKYIYTIPDLEK